MSSHGDEVLALKSTGGATSQTTARRKWQRKPTTGEKKLKAKTPAGRQLSEPQLGEANEGSDVQSMDVPQQTGPQQTGNLGQVNSIWPKPFPGYKGLFTYRVAASKRAADANLGNGVYLWALDILPGTVVLQGRRNSSTMDMQCKMKKTLLDLPEDACAQMKACKDCYVIEHWYGLAHSQDRVFRLASIGEHFVESTIDFEVEGMPLSRPILAGEYEMLLAEDETVIRAVHASWVEFAKINPDEATGIMFRVDSGSTICPMLRPQCDDTLVKKLRQATDLLQGATVYQRGEPRKVYYHPINIQMHEINSITGQFQAMIVVSMEYLMTRDDVFEYIIRPDGWRPEWLPNNFEVMNAGDTNSVSVWVETPRLKINTEGNARCVHAHIVVTYQGIFAEKFEMEAFPFDVQPLCVRMRAVEEHDVTMVLVRQECKNLVQMLRPNWMIPEWYLLDVLVPDMQQEALDRKSNKLKALTIHSNGMETRMEVICTVQRHARSYLIRIFGVLLLIALLSICIFVIDLADDLPDRIGHSFMMLLTLTTYSQVVGDVLPVLGYLTIIDKVVLACFVFLSMVVLQITFIGFLSTNEDLLDWNAAWWNGFFALSDLGIVVLLAIFSWVYVSFVVIPRELRKSPERLSLDDAQPDLKE